MLILKHISYHNDSTRRCGLKSVVIIHHEFPLLAGIERLLSTVAGLKLITVSSTDVVDIVNEINQLQPEIVILDENLPGDGTSRLLNLLITFPELRLVVVNGLHNQLQVYDKKEVLVSCFDDLISAVQSS